MPISKRIWAEYCPICAKCGENVSPEDYRYFYLNREEEIAIYFHRDCCPVSDSEFLEFNVKIIRDSRRQA